MLEPEEFLLKFNVNNKPLAAAFGQALINYAGGVIETSGAHIIGNRPEVNAIETAKSDSAADVEQYNESEVVKLNDSAAGLSESQSDVSAETQVQETVEHAAGGVPDVDKNGVPPNWSFCAKAAKPFYASGKMSGQWKKGTKVAQEDYDKWYAAAKADAVAAHPANTDAAAEQFDTSQAFSNDTKQPEVVNTGAPVGIGPFIMWTAEMQAAKHLTQDDISGAYKLLGIEQADISPANSNAQANIAALHAVLSDKVKA